MRRPHRLSVPLLRPLALALAAVVALALPLRGQGVTTSAMNGFVTTIAGQPLEGALVTAVHVPTGTTYTTLTRPGGAFTIPNMRIGGPYSVTVQMIGYADMSESDIDLRLGQTFRLDFELREQAVAIEGLEVTVEESEVFNASRTGAETFVDEREVTQLPSVKRSTRDLIRVDPRSDGNYAFAGRNWLFNNISVDGSYFNNPFGLDDPAPGGQSNAEPVPFEAIEQVQVSLAPFDVREGGFTGANVNSVTRSGTNEFGGSVYTFIRNENFIGNEVSGDQVIADPDLSFNQSGFTFSGPIVRDKLFFFVNGELERRDDPGTNFAPDTDGTVQFGESRVSLQTMQQIRQRMIDAYGYDPGPFQDYIHETNNDKLLVKLDWNINDDNNLSFRWNFLDASREQGPHPFVLSVNNSGRGPNSSSLPFRNAGYRINNELNSFALELNSRGQTFSNRFFASYNRFRDFREPFSDPFPTVEIGEDGVTYTTLGHEPFSIHNILDQDVFQITNNLSFFRGNHTFTVGGNFEHYGFFNSFNIFRHGVFFLPYFFGIGSTFSSLDEFFEATDPNNPDQFEFRDLITPDGVPFKGENIDVGQLSFYAQDEFLVSRDFTLTYGLRLDLPMYFTDPVDNPFSRGLAARDEDGNMITVDQSNLPGTKALVSPRVGFNWDVNGDRTTQLRGGTGIFTGRIPFVWFGNVISNPGANPNLFPEGPEIPTSDDSVLQQSFDVNTMDQDFKWPQVWVTNAAIDQVLGDGLSGTLEVIYGNDLNAIVMRNLDLAAPQRTLSDGRPYYGGAGVAELNPDGGAGIYHLDNTDEGYNLNVTAQLRKAWADLGLNTTLSYSFTQAKNNLKSTEIASVLWQSQPVQGDPNNPRASFSEFNHRHRITAAATYNPNWSERFATSFGVFVEVAEGNRFATSGGNRYSFTYGGDYNGDGVGGNDLIFIPAEPGDVRLADPSQWDALNAFIEQDDYLSQHRGEIAERFGGVNPWYSNIDLRVIQDLNFFGRDREHRLQLNLDLLNVANFLNSDWGVRKVANPAATTPLAVDPSWDGTGDPIVNFVGPSETFIDDPGILSRWQFQVGLKYIFN